MEILERWEVNGWNRTAWYEEPPDLIEAYVQSVIKQSFDKIVQGMLADMRQESARDWAKTAVLRYQPVRANIIQSITIS